MRSTLHDLEVLFVRQTPAAVCIKLTEDKLPVWVPKSQCELEVHDKKTGRATLVAEERLLTEKGLV